MFNFRNLRAASGRCSFTRLTLSALFIFTLTILALAASAGNWFPSGASAAAMSPAAAAGTLSPPPQQEEKGVITLLTSGFNPTQVSGAAGYYRLALTRPSWQEQIVLQLKREGGELVQEIVMPQDKLDWTTLVEIGAGSYTLTVNNHPEWVCRITVE